MKDLKLSIEISRELASSVLGLNVVYTESCEHRDGIIGIWTDINTKPIKEISIYELDFICREWAYIKGFIVEIGVHPIIKQNRNDKDYFYAIKTLNGELLKKSNVDEVMKSEPTATFKACNWILEQIK